MQAALKALFQQYTSRKIDLGMLLFRINLIVGDIPISRLNTLLNDFYKELE